MDKKTNSIGYLIPKFPGQTHNFFWRELNVLHELGITTHLTSTRHPAKGIVSPSWARQAEEETVYLYPLSVREALHIIWLCLCAGPTAWFNCVKIVLRAKDLPVLERIKLFAFVPFAAKLVQIAKKKKWNHVHVHSCGNAANIALFAKQLSNLTYSLTLHNCSLQTYGGNQEQKWSHASFAIIVAKCISAEICQLLGPSLPGYLDVAPMGVDVDKFSRTFPYKPYCGDDALRLFSCARLNIGKGFDILVPALALIKDKGIDVRLFVAGEDESGGSGYRIKLEKQIADLGLSSQIVLLGAIPEEQVKDQLEQAHIFVLATREEALGVAIMEAMAMNVPAVATKVGGIPELISNEIDGILVPSNDPEDFADAILSLAKDQKKAEQISKVCRNKIVQHFNHRKSAQAIEKALKNLNSL